MAVTIEELRATLRLEMKPFMRDLQQMNGVSAKAARQVENTWRATNKRLDGIGRNMARSLVAPMAGIGALLGAQEIIRLTDTWTDLNSRVALAAGGIEQGTEVMARLGDMARRTYSDLEQTAESYLANSTALQELGYSTNQALDYTESLNNALVVSGAKGQRAATVTDALAKAMALGKLSGVNLNTVISQGGRVAEALAAGLNTTVGGLRKLGAQGKITGNDLVQALSSQMEVLRKEAADMPATIGDGIQLLNNAFLQYVGNADTAAGVSAKISEALVIMADNFDKTADVALQLAGVIAGALIGRSLLKMISTLGLAGSALINFTRALSAAKTMAGLATAFTGLSAAAGPVGMLIGGTVVSSLLLYNSTSSDASEGARLFAERLKEVEEAAKSSADAVDEAGASNSSYNLNSLKAEVKAGSKEFENAKQKAQEYFDEIIAGGIPLEKVTDAMGKVSRQPMVTPEQFQQLQALRDELSKNSDRAAHVKDALQALANSNPNFQALADQLNPLLDKLIHVATAARLANAELADRNTSRGRSAKDDILPIDLNGIAADTYEQEALRRAALGKSQLTLENEIAKVRNDALKEGITLTEKQIETIAKANIAGDASRSAEGKKPKKEKRERDNDYERLTKSITDRTATMIAETEVQRQLNPLIDDYGYAVEKARAEQELLNAAQKAGVVITPELRAEIGATAEQFAIATVEAGKLAEAQDKIRQNAEEMAEFQKDLTRGMVDGFIQGKKAADIFADALSKIGNKLLDLAFNGLFDIKSGGGGGGFLGGILGFSEGGYTGSGGKNQPAGVVHKGEVVWSQKDIARAGGVSAVEAMRNGLAGYSAGGPVAIPTPPRMPNLKAPSAQGSGIAMTFSPVIDARGADQAAVDRLQRGLEKTNREMEGRVIQAVRKAQNANVRLG